jgi:hypothetical protein
LWRRFTENGHGVADLPLEAAVGHQPLERLGIQPREVARVRVAIGVAVGHVEEQDEVISPRHSGRSLRSGVSAHSTNSSEIDGVEWSGL